MISVPKVNKTHKRMTILSVIVPLITIGVMITVPRLQRSLISARETNALASLAEIHRAEVSFHKVKAPYATINELVAEELLRKSYADGKPVGGYVFTDADVTAKTFTIHAVRKSVGDGYRDYSVHESGDVYYVESKEKTGQVLRGQGTLVGE